MNKKLRYLFSIVLAGVLVFSVVRFVQIQLDYKAGNEIYEQALQQFVSEQPAPSSPAMPNEAETEPPQEEAEGEDTPGLPVVKSVANMVVNFEELKKVNSEVIGWLVIEGSVINYPIVQGDDNDKYLHTTYNGRRSMQGSIFMDSYNNSDFSSRHTIIYGHNMRNNSMFGSLSQFSRKNYFENHRYFYIFTETEKRKYAIFAVYVAEIDSNTYQRVFTAEQDFTTFITDISGRSQIDTGVEVGTDDLVVTLSTCTANSSDTKRFVVQGKLI